MISIGIRITDKCDFTCKHCMFSCTSKGKEMSDKLLADIAKFIKDYNEDIEKRSMSETEIPLNLELYLKRINSISITGGETFLNIEKLSSFIDSVYSDDVGVSVFTNGSFLLDASKRKYFIDLLNKIKNNNSSDNTFIKFTTDEFHKEFHNEELSDWLSKVKELIKQPSKFNEYFNYDTENPFLPRYQDMLRQDYCECVEDAYTMLVSFYKEKGLFVNPCGRALENKVYTDGGCLSGDCPFTQSKEGLEQYYFNNLGFTIDYNGDILICASSKSCVVANFYEPNFSLELIKERISELHKTRRYYANATERINVCTECKKINLVGGSKNE